jgi:DNA-binding MarR family transcriptional regulator
MPDRQILINIIAHLTQVVAEAQTPAGLAFSDLTMRQVVYLDCIHRMENPTPSELARKLSITRASVSVALDRLAEAGYLSKVQSDQDRRSFHVHLTPKGEQYIQLHEQVHQRLADLLTQGLTAAEIEQLTGLLHKVAQSLEAGPGSLPERT